MDSFVGNNENQNPAQQFTQTLLDYMYAFPLLSETLVNSTMRPFVRPFRPSISLVPTGPPPPPTATLSLILRTISSSRDSAAKEYCFTVFAHSLGQQSWWYSSLRLFQSLYCMTWSASWPSRMFTLIPNPSSPLSLASTLFLLITLGERRLMRAIWTSRATLSWREITTWITTIRCVLSRCWWWF